MDCSTYNNRPDQTPDIAHAVNILSRYLSNPGKRHWYAAKRVLRYLKGTKTVGLDFGKPNYDLSKQKLTITAYSDADYAGDLDERLSTSGYVVLINDNVVSWASKRQPTQAQSTAEAEYMALTLASQETEFLTQFLEEIGLYNRQRPVVIFTDSQSAEAMANNDVNHGKTKHIEIKQHWIRRLVKEKKVELMHVGTKDMIADVYTKALGPKAFSKCCERIVSKAIGQI